jgi:hypothetical protein
MTDKHRDISGNTALNILGIAISQYMDKALSGEARKDFALALLALKKEIEDVKDRHNVA